uniref:Secreted protein n=1 Tax=Knipowitschia caucasica TaxID=637954 RepID=A0AAV2MHU0_KNICA
METPVSLVFFSSCWGLVALGCNRAPPVWQTLVKGLCEPVVLLRRYLWLVLNYAQWRLRARLRSGSGGPVLSLIASLHFSGTELHLPRQFGDCQSSQVRKFSAPFPPAQLLLPPLLWIDPTGQRRSSCGH